MESASRPLLAAVFMSGAMLSFTMMAVAGRKLAGLHDTFEIMMYRSLVGVVIVLVAGGWAGTLREISTRQLPLQIVRNVFHFGGQNLWFFAVGMIPLSQVFALEFTTPLWVALLAPAMLGERWRSTRLLAAAMGFAGILIVARPGAMAIGPGEVAGMLCALGFAGAILFTKILARRNSVTCILFWLVVTQSVFGFVTAGIDGDIAAPTATSAPFLVIVGFCGLFSHFCITNALRVAPASVVGPMDFLRLPLVAIVAFLVFSEALEWQVFLGAGIVFAANMINIRAEQRRRDVPA